MFLCLVFLMLSRLVVTCWERADLLALVGYVYGIFITFRCGILGQVWYLMYRFLIFAVFLTLDENFAFDKETGLDTCNRIDI